MLWDSVLTLPDVFTVTDIEHIITELCTVGRVRFYPVVAYVSYVFLCTISFVMFLNVPCVLFS